MNSESVFTPVLTKAALLLKNKPEFTATVFQEPTFTKSDRKADESRKRSQDSADKPNGPKSKNDTEFDIKKARHEVINFAIDGARTIKNKKKMQIVKAIKLGAKPPKKPCKNYKELKDERQRLKTIREERQKFHQLGKNQTGAAAVRCCIRKSVAAKKQKKRAPITQIAKNYGVVNPTLKKKK